MDTRQVALLSVLTALCLGIQLAPRPPNVESTSLICFTVGVIFGAWTGAFLGGMTMFINGFLSPWGFAGLIMPFQIVGMAIIGIAGGIYRKSQKENPSASRLIPIEVAALGAFLTLVYDIITNAGFALLFNVNLIFVLMMGTRFAIIHVCSNAALFGSAFLPLLTATKQLYRG